VNLLIFRFGSIGDTVVALPCLRLIARAFPNANRILLTNYPRSGEASTKLVLDGMGIAHDYISYPLGMRDVGSFANLRRQIISLGVDALVYLTPRHHLIDVLRDMAFFRICGISNIIGAPTTAALRNWERQTVGGLWEHEASRLARCLRPIGDARVADVRSWSLELTDLERRAAAEALSQWNGRPRFVVVAAGAKTSAKDWGLVNWIAAISALRAIGPGWGLAFVGSAEDGPRVRELAAQWGGPTLDLCGKLSPRVSAAVIERAQLFLGHDGGPMHLAAAVGIPIVALFSGRANPGTWFPFQEGADIFYPSKACICRGREICGAREQGCMMSLKPDDVVAACFKRLTETGSHANGK